MTLLTQRSRVPWTLPAVQQLLELLCDFYPDFDSIRAVYSGIGLPAARDLSPGKPPYYTWWQALEKVVPRGGLGALLERAIEEFPESPGRPFLERLLVEPPEQLAVDARPDGAIGERRFIDGDDAVSQPEALLFHDDLLLTVPRLPWLMHALERMLQLSPAVCKLVARGPKGTQYGTGFLIGERQIMTAAHVVTDAFAVEAMFGYDDDGSHIQVSAVTKVNADLATLVLNVADDWATFSLAEAPPAVAEIIDLTSAAEPIVGEAAFIIQHPRGELKRVAYTRNTITGFSDRSVHYLSDTQGGSSGSPVLNAEGRIIALHRMGGTPQTIAGRPPLQKNEGVNIAWVRLGLPATQDPGRPT